MFGDCSILLDKTLLLLKTGRKYEDCEDRRTGRKYGDGVARLDSNILLLNAVRNLPVVDLGKSGVRNADLQRNLGHPDSEVGIA